MIEKSQSILETAKRVFRIEAQEVNRLADQLSLDFVKAVEAILACKGRVVVCGMGKSGHIGKKIAATLSSTGTPSFFMHPAEAFHGDLGMITKDDIFLGISNSGETEEIIRLIPAVRRNGNQLIVLCGQANSTLVRNADFFLNISIEHEACPLSLAPMSSTTATLAMGDALAVALMELKDFKPENFALFHPGGSLGKKLLATVADVMRTDNLPFVSSETSLRDLILTMTECKMGLAIVVDNQNLTGIITDGDLRRSWEQLALMPEKCIPTIMTRSPKTISPDAMLTDAEKILNQHKINVLVVVKAQKPVGVLHLNSINL